MDELIAALRRQIGDELSEQSPQFSDDPAYLATFACPSGAVGDVVVEADEYEATVHISGMTHGHFDMGETPAEIAQDVVDFLRDLFAGEVVVWCSENGRSGGWFYKSHAEEANRRHKGYAPTRIGTWLGPWNDPLRSSP